jgi:stress-induced morphogen
VLAEELAGKIHALAVSTLTPSERAALKPYDA